MKIHTPLATLFSIACVSLAHAAEPQQGSKQLQVFPKNLARQHLGSNLFVFNTANGTYVPTEASAAWLDDDATTGWPVMAGKQSYLLVLSEPELLTNFSVSARAANGTVTLFAGDEPTAPGSSSWKPVAKDVAFDAINDHRLAKPFNTFAKYLLIQTDIADPGPIYGLYVYSDKAAVNYNLQKREQSIDARAIFGQYTNNQTGFSLSGLYSGARVSAAETTGGAVSWQRAIDDNPETAVSVPAGKTTTVALAGVKELSRVSVYVDKGAKGKLDFYTTASPTATAPSSPTVSIVLDGTNPRASIDFPKTEAAQLQARWTPDNGTDSLTVRELSAFDGLTLNDYEVSLKPEAIAEGHPDFADTSKDGKDFVDPKKNPLDPVALGPGGSPYLPGALGFPPNPTSRSVQIPPSVSP